jgi:hypothetical protein
VPELPEVEGFRRTFALCAEDKRMHGVRAIDRGMLRSSSPASLGRALSGRRFASAAATASCSSVPRMGQRSFYAREVLPRGAEQAGAGAR